MTKLMQTASALTLAAALTGMPMIVSAQTATTTTTEQATTTEKATDTAAEKTNDAAQATKDAAATAGDKVENAADATKDAAKDAGEKVESAVQTNDKADKVEENAENKADAIEKSAEGKGDAAEDAAEKKAEKVEEAGEQKAEAIENGDKTAATAANGEAAPAPVKGTIRMQDDNSILTSDLIGADLYNAQAEKIGEIDDAILSLDGTINGVVIGVGGFLGLGEKKVAVEMQQISVQKDKDGDPQLFIDTTKEALKAAPEFVTAEDQRDEAKRMDAATATSNANQPAGTVPAAGGMAPAPADTATQAPADATKPVQN